MVSWIMIESGKVKGWMIRGPWEPGVEQVWRGRCQMGQDGRERYHRDVFGWLGQMQARSKG